MMNKNIVEDILIKKIFLRKTVRWTNEESANKSDKKIIVSTIILFCILLFSMSILWNRDIVSITNYLLRRQVKSLL